MKATTQQAARPVMSGLQRAAWRASVHRAIDSLVSFPEAAIRTVRARKRAGKAAGR